MHISFSGDFSFSVFDELNLLITQLDPCNPIIFTGDFNFHFENDELAQVKQFKNLMSSCGFSQFVSGPTHKRGHTLDLLFANENYFTFDNVCPIDLSLSDHFPIFFDVPICPNVQQHTKKQIVYRDYRSIDIPAFSDSICNALDTAFVNNLNNSTFCESLKTYEHIVSNELNSIAPERTKVVQNLSTPRWMDGEYKLARAARRRLERKWKNSHLDSDRKAYIDQRDKCIELSEDKRIIYFNEIIKNNKGNMQALFKIANTIFDKNCSSHILPQYDNAKSLGDQFNSFYNDKVDKIRKQIPQTSFDRLKYSKSFKGVALSSFRPTTVAELSEILKSSGIKTSFHDILPAHLLKKVLDSLLPYFCFLVNQSLSTGSVEGLKDSIVNPLLKKSGIDPETLKNYRPVSDLLFLSKLTERVVDRRLFEHMSINNLHCVYEHGYKKMHSTETLLLPLVNNTLLSLDSELAVIWILIDLSAAFDTVDIDLELHILENEIGIHGTALGWFKSFLSGRKQSVLIEKSVSEAIEVQYGVPQGSVLGPILFNIYIKSLFELINAKGFQTSGYADDNNASQNFALQFQFDVINYQLYCK